MSNDYIIEQAEQAVALAEQRSIVREGVQIALVDKCSIDAGIDRAKFLQLQRQADESEGDGFDDGRGFHYNNEALNPRKAFEALNVKQVDEITRKELIKRGIPL